MDRLDYFIRRILLIIPTFIGITFLCFTIIQFVPGGPVEQAIMRMRGGGEAARPFPLTRARPAKSPKRNANTSGSTTDSTSRFRNVIGNGS